MPVVVSCLLGRRACLGSGSPVQASSTWSTYTASVRANTSRGAGRNERLTARIASRRHLGTHLDGRWCLPDGEARVSHPDLFGAMIHLRSPNDPAVCPELSRRPPLPEREMVTLALTPGLLRRRPRLAWPQVDGLGYLARVAWRPPCDEGFHPPRRVNSSHMDGQTNRCVRLNGRLSWRGAAARRHPQGPPTPSRRSPS